MTNEEKDNVPELWKTKTEKENNEKEKNKEIRLNELRRWFEAMSDCV